MQQYIGIVALILWLSPINANATELCLSLSNFHQQKEHLSIPLGTQQQFALSFIHSVSETPVVDYYQISDNQKIIQTTERFEHHGAGLPSNISEGIDWEKRDGYFWLSMQRPINQLIVRTDKNYKNRLYIGATNKKLTELKQVNLNQWQDQALLISITQCN